MIKPLALSIILAAGVVITATVASAAGHAGSSASHMSEQGAANTNGPNAADRDKGLDRAEDRMSQEGLEHNKATTRQSKKQNSKSAHSNAGGASASHMSPQGAANTNGPNAVDRDKGLARAEDRANRHATENPKATTPLER